MSKPENLTCPICGAAMTPRTSEHGKFWGCTRFRQGCRGTRNSLGEAPLRRDDFERRADDGLPSERQRQSDRRRWER